MMTYDFQLAIINLKKHFANSSNMYHDIDEDNLFDLMLTNSTQDQDHEDSKIDASKNENITINIIKKSLNNDEGFIKKEEEKTDDTKNKFTKIETVELKYECEKLGDNVVKILNQ